MNISHKITHHAPTNYSTQSYTNNKGHITHTEYNALNSGAVSVRGRCSEDTGNESIRATAQLATHVLPISPL
jgi:hypothetical protein